MRLPRSTTDFGAYLCATQYQTDWSTNKESSYDQERATLLYPTCLISANTAGADFSPGFCPCPGCPYSSSHWCWAFLHLPGYSAGENFGRLRSGLRGSRASRHYLSRQLTG